MRGKFDLRRSTRSMWRGAGSGRQQDMDQKYFFDDLNPGDRVLAFGAVHDAVHDPAASSKAVLSDPVNEL